MTKKEQISKFLQEWNGDGYTVQDVYIEKECADLMAEGIVKLFSIPNVSQQRELLLDLICEIKKASLAIPMSNEKEIRLRSIIKSIYSG